MSIRRKLKEKLGLLNFKGKMLWGSVKCDVPLEYTCKFKFEENQFQYEGLIRLAKELDIRDLMDDDDSRGMILQVLNIDMKQKLRLAGMYELGKASQYYAKNQERNADIRQLEEEGKLTVLRGFKFTLAPLSKGIFLQIDVCSRVLQSENVWQ